MRDMAQQETKQISLYVGVVCSCWNGWMYCRKDMGIKEMCILLIMHNGCAFSRDRMVHEKKERVSRSVLRTEIPFSFSTS